MLRLSCLARKSFNTPKRSTVHARSNAKAGKERFDLKEAMRRDRERIERNKKLGWRERLEDLKVYPWKFFVAFMVFWSWLGTYVVPYLKEGDDSRKRLPADIVEKASSKHYLPQNRLK